MTTNHLNICCSQGADIRSLLINSIIYIISFFILLISLPAQSHEIPSGESEKESLELILQIYQQVVELSPSILQLSSKEDPTKQTAQAILRVKDHNIVMNSYFWHLVSLWVQAYYQELNKDCQQCQWPSVDIVIEEAKDLAAQGFFQQKVVHPLGEGLQHIVMETADLGARLGQSALVAKVTAEVAEAVLSKTVGGGGVHVLCSAIDAVILFGTRHLQVAMRIPSMAHYFDQPALYALFKTWWVKSAARRAEKRVQFELGPFELDQEALEIIDQEGPSRWWGWVDNGKRAQWLKWLAGKIQPLQAEKLQILAIPAEQRTSSQQQQLIKIERKILQLSQIKKANFLGHRKKRFAFLLSRKTHPHYLTGTTAIDKILRRDVLWMASVQEGILNRALIHSQNETESIDELTRVSSQTSQDPIVQGLIQEFLTNHPHQNHPLLQEWLYGLLGDIERIFDHSVSAPSRYLLTLVIESVVTGLIYQSLRHQLTFSPIESHGYWSNLWHGFGLRFRSGYFARYAFEWSDFLRTASVTSDPVALAQHKYESMEVFLRLLKHISHLQTIISSPSSTQRLPQISILNRQLQSFRPWREKKRHYTWLPIWPKGLPRCEEIARK